MGCGEARPDSRPEPAAPAPAAVRRVAAPDLDLSAMRQTVVENPATAPLRKGDLPKIPTPESSVEQADTEEGVPPAAPDPSRPVQFVVRLLLPDGDRRNVEVGTDPVFVGSGLDELGLHGDPRVGRSEAKLWVEEGALFLEPRDGAEGVFRRIAEEHTLVDDDVVLMGDIAALFARVDPGPPVDGSRQVLGGSANTPCGRLTFLRRDGSLGPVHDLPAGKTVLGRTDGHLNFPQDTRLSRRHARFFASDQSVTLEDLDSRNGTYLRVRGKIALGVGDALRIGSSGVQIRAQA